jgi:hypothetical protein
MKKEHVPPAAPAPFQVLGVAPGATDEEIRKAYLVRIEEAQGGPPEETDLLMLALKELRDPMSRARHELCALDPFVPLAELADEAGTERKFVGITAWLKVLKED